MLHCCNHDHRPSFDALAFLGLCVLFPPLILLAICWGIAGLFVSSPAGCKTETSPADPPGGD